MRYRFPFEEQMIAPAEEELNLTPDDVHIWSASLVSLPIRIERLQQVLNVKERYRASQFRFEKDRNQFIACRGLLRQILSLYVHKDPAQLQLCSNAFGKPELRSEGRTERENLRFNYSHTDGLAVFAFARGREVGVDVEFIQPQFADSSIPEHFFHQSEVSALRELPARLQSRAFLQCWTRKEAYIKGRGEGFRIPLDSFEVSSDRIIAEDGNSSWSLQSFVPATGYVAALAAEGQGWSTRFIQSSQRFFTQQEDVPCCTF